ncbi:MAG: peptidylprolyl isomerase [Sulfuricaulis sp.]
MSTLRTLFIVFLAALGLLAASCDKKSAEQTKSAETSDASKIIATVDGHNITQSEYDNYRQMRDQQVGPITDKTKEKQIVLNELIDTKLLSQYAIDNKLDQDPEISAIIKRVHEEILAQAVKRKLLQDKPITEDDVKQRFEQEVEKTNKTEYKVRHILVSDQAEAKDIIAQLQKGANFAKLAKEKSIDTQSSKSGGEIGWINQGTVVPDFFNAVIKMKKGSITTEPVKTDFGWHIIQVEDTRPLKIPTFEQFMANQGARANIYRKMQDEKVNGLVEELRAKAKIAIN